MEKTPYYRVPANEVSILFGKRDSSLILSIIENYLNFFLQINPSTEIKNRDTAIGLCVTASIHNAFVQDYLAHLKCQIKKIENKKSMPIDLHYFLEIGIMTEVFIFV